MKYLVIGDLHAQIGNLEDTEKILQFLSEICKKAGIVVFLGDMYHTHSVIRQEVVNLFRKYLPKIFGNVQFGKPHVLVGNHDYVGPTNTSMNSISLTLGDVVHVVDGPYTDGCGGSYMPFTPNNDEFVERANKIRSDVLFCHQTFDSAKFENGFYAPNGVDQGKLMARNVVSGHIHKQQKIGKVFYVGTPRALTANDYNEDKGVFLLDLNEETGELSIAEYFSFNKMVKCYRRIDFREGNDDNSYAWDDLTGLGKNDDVTLSIHGSQEFCDKMQEDLKEFNLPRVRIALDVKKETQRRLSLESGGSTVEDALKKYVFEIADVDAKLKDDVWKTVQNAMS